jgi:tetraacyldisaccharide 4'-kinase
MVRFYLIRILLLPFSLLYGVGVTIRNALYKYGFLNSVSFSIPVISVGNLTVGGAGKTPHVEYLIQLLRPYLNVTTLSRGYKRKTKGFLEVQPHFNAQQAGDEPVQFKRKHPDIGVFVDESRMFGIPRIVMKYPETQSVILDDAFQHLSVKPGLNILLTEYDRPFFNDWLLPSGRLREWRNAYKRADIIIVSKCPQDMDPSEKEDWLKQLQPLPHQKVFFSYYEYGNPYHLYDPNRRIGLNENLDVLLVSGIARTDYLLDYLEPRTHHVKVLEYEDHHDYSPFDIGRIHKHYQSMPKESTILLTTEKDAIRLQAHRKFILENQIPVFALPIRVAFHFDEGEDFDKYVKDFLLGFEA